MRALPDDAVPDSVRAVLNAVGHAGLVDHLPVAAYVCAADGTILRYNEAAAALWGREPELGERGTRFCGSHSLFGLDGAHIPHHVCPMAAALASGEGCREQEIIVERPDGSRIVAVVNIEVIRDAAGTTVGAVNTFRDSSGGRDRSSMSDEAEKAIHRLAAIVESSEDAILAKDLDGVITDWNRGAQELYGYTAREVVGKPVTVLIPDERHDEEPAILARIRRGERIEPYETVRRRKDGSMIDISLSVSPIVDRLGRVIGASKIARDITGKKRAEEQQVLLLREMNHRVKNLFTLSGSLVKLSARSGGTADDLVAALQERFGALARAHSLTLPATMDQGSRGPAATTLHALLDTIVSPFAEAGDTARPRVVLTGPDMPVSGSAVTSVALLFHEFATNAAKYGAFAAPQGRVTIECTETDETHVVIWRETGALPHDFEPGREGFGSLLARTAITGALGGSFTREFTGTGLVITLSLPRGRLAEG